MRYQHHSSFELMLLHRLRQTVSVLPGVVILLALVGTASAQSADKVIKQALKAKGGEKALRNVRAWQSQGTIKRVGDGSTGKYRAAATLPNLYTEIYDIQGFEVSVGYNGKSGWMRDSRNGLRTLTGNAGRDFQLEATWRNTRWLDYKKDKSKLLAAGQSSINGRTATTVLLTTAKGVKIRMHFDAASGLLIREEIPAGELTRVLDYSDYRAIDGVMEPHAVNLTVGPDSYEIRLDQVTHNLPVERTAFDFPKVLNEPLPDAQALMKEVGKNEEEIDQLLEKYTYTETITKRELDQSGQLRDKDSEKFELTFFKGNRIRRLIEKNSRPLSADETEKESRRIEKRVRELEKKETEKEKKAQKEREVAQETGGTPDADNGQRISISDVLRASKLVNPRRERFRGREVIVFDFEPLPGYKPQKNYEKFFGKTAGAIWIDAADKQVARVEARLVEAYKIAGGMLASLKEGATFVLEQDRVNNEIWLPTRADISLSLKVLMVKGINEIATINYGDYKRFNVDAEKEKLKDPVKP